MVDLIFLTCPNLKFWQQEKVVLMWQRSFCWQLRPNGLVQCFWWFLPLRNIAYFFEILFASTIFVSSHVFSDCCFLMFLKISVFLRLLLWRSSTSTSNSRIVIAWLLTVSFISANLNFKLSIYSLLSRLCTSFMGCSLNCIYLEESMSFLTLSSLSSNDISLVPSSLNLALGKSLISSKLLLLAAVCCY